MLNLLAASYDDNFDIVARFIIPLSECKKYCEKKVGRGFKEKFWKPLIIKIAVVAY